MCAGYAAAAAAAAAAAGVVLVLLLLFWFLFVLLLGSVLHLQFGGLALPYVQDGAMRFGPSASNGSGNR